MPDTTPEQDPEDDGVLQPVQVPMEEPGPLSNDVAHTVLPAEEESSAP